ncbi:MAG: immunoglobulin domain-containing protein [Tepidisphaera sp.]
MASIRCVPLAALLSGGLLAASAHAQQSLGAVLGIEVAPQGTGSFSRFLATGPLQAVDVRVVARFNEGAAFANAVYNIRGDRTGFTGLTATNPRRIAPFNFGAQTLAVFTTATGFRIDDTRDAADSTTMGIISGQRPPQIGQPANISNPAEVFRFTVTTPNEAGLLHIRIPWEQIRNELVTVYLNPIDPATRTLADFGVDGAWVYVGGSPCVGQQVTTPPSRAVLAGTTVTLATTGDSSTWQWFRNGTELHDSRRFRGTETAALTIQNSRPEDSGDYTLFTLCSHTGAVRVDVFCRSDFNNDGFTDFFDYVAYVDCFELGDCPQTLPERTADYNGDGFADFFDYDAYVRDFEAGTC